MLFYLPGLYPHDHIFCRLQGERPARLQDFLYAAVRGVLNLPCAFNAALILILFDTSYYRSHTTHSVSLFEQMVITPLNFIRYNHNRFVDWFLCIQSDSKVPSPCSCRLTVSQSLDYCSENLAEHGIHPHYLHAAVNTPILFGPLVAFLILLFYLMSNIKDSGKDLRLVSL